MIRQKLLKSDMVVFATPLYYCGMTAQLKTVVDRFCAYNSSLNSAFGTVPAVYAAERDGECIRWE